ncbi:MAG: hypothetical protein H6662_16275 [Ardenticatenaceae bacterium]|nr:hypothetical protein [Anaerolineales bacterium]MCB8923144.1 hypothetical protein [Ardenticatenaceae bacterium]MCB9005207.1 hypothetical protein [Ardenticatenaceae bacterium]
MPYLLPPKTDTQRLNFLRTAAQSTALDYGNKLEYISLDTFKELEAFLPQFDEAFLDVANTFGELDREVVERDEALDKLKQYLDDMWEVVRRRVARNGEPVGVLRFYYLEPDGTEPQPDSLEGWFDLAEKVIAGDGDAAEAGYDTAVCPTTAELQAVLDAARREAADVVPADEAYDRAQAAIEAMRAQANELIDDVLDELRFHLRKEEAASQRRIMRTYGAKFGYRPGEPRDMDDVEE